MKRKLQLNKISTLALVVFFGLLTVVFYFLKESRPRAFLLPTIETLSEDGKYECKLYGYYIMQAKEDSRIGHDLSTDKQEDRRILDVEVKENKLVFSSEDFFNDPFIFSDKWHIDKDDDDERLTASFFDTIGYGGNTGLTSEGLEHNAGVFMFEKGNGRAVLTRTESDPGKNNDIENNTHRTRSLYFVCQ